MTQPKKAHLALKFAFVVISIVVIASGWRAVPRCGWTQAVPLLIFSPLAAVLTATAIRNLMALVFGGHKPVVIAIDEDGRPLPVGLGSALTAVTGLCMLIALANPECLATDVF